MGGGVGIAVLVNIHRLLVHLHGNHCQWHRILGQTRQLVSLCGLHSTLGTSGRLVSWGEGRRVNDVSATVTDGLTDVSATVTDGLTYASVTVTDGLTDASGRVTDGLTEASVTVTDETAARQSSSLQLM